MTHNRLWRLILRRLPLVVLAVAVVVWLVAKGSESGTTFVQVTLNGLTLAALLFVVAAGFTLIFGLMRVVNMAHGSLFLFAGYLAFKAQEAWFGVSSNLLGNSGAITVASWVVSLIFACAVVGLIGIAMQQLLLRWNQGQELRQALITIAISVIAADQLEAHYGGVSQSIQTPTSWPISVSVLGTHYGFFRLVIVGGSAIVVGALLYLMIKRTRFGMVVRAGVDDRAMVSAMGINIQLVFAAAFFVGALLAALGGVLAGTMLSIQPGNDSQFLLYSLIVVIIGGMGSLGGAAIGALALGLVNSYSDVYLQFGSTNLTNYAILLTFILVVAVLAVRPLGLFGRPA
ncbi:MAG: branched-chain amino acid ABC transporter permease [Solirubrobacterales bacterium]|nr:branched-chain amino acid ABC transporter permease [Solirubrobacterales bacterium]